MKNAYLDKSSKNSVVALVALTVVAAGVAGYGYMKSSTISADTEVETASVAQYSTEEQTLLANLVLGVNTIVNSTGESIDQDTKIVSLAGQLVSISEANEMGAISMMGKIQEGEYIELNIANFTILNGETFVVKLSDDALNPKIVY
jgi:hypothetical protein